MSQSLPLLSFILAHSSLPMSRINALARVDKKEIIFEFADETLSLPLQGLQIKWGGANNSLLFLSHPDRLGWTAFSRDQTLIGRLKVFADQELTAKLQNLEKQVRRNHMGCGLFVIIAFCLIWGMWASRNLATQLLAGVVPQSWERKLGEAVYTGVRSNTKIVDDEALTKELTDFLEPIVTTARESGYKFEFHIANDDELNAFALPGGIIVINSGTLLHAEHLEEVLGVLAHEMAHVTRRHMTRQVITVFGLYVVVDFVFGNIFGTVAAISQGTAYLLQQGFSRESEEEADLYGLEYLRAANINPLGMVEFFKRIQNEHAISGVSETVEKSLTFLSTHPATESRIQIIMERIQSTPGAAYRTLPEEAFRDFQTKLRRAT